MIPALLVAFVALAAVGLMLFQVGRSTTLRAQAQTGADAGAVAGAEAVRADILAQVQAWLASGGWTKGPPVVRLLPALDPVVGGACSAYATRNTTVATSCLRSGQRVKADVLSVDSIDPQDAARVNINGQPRGRAQADACVFVQGSIILVGGGGCSSIPSGAGFDPARFTTLPIGLDGVDVASLLGLKVTVRLVPTT